MVSAPDAGEHVTIPSYIKTIGTFAFSGSGVKTIDYSNSEVTAIDLGAFFECDLQEIVLPDTLKRLSASYYNIDIGENIISIPNTLTDMDAYAFEKCTVGGIDISSWNYEDIYDGMLAGFMLDKIIISEDQYYYSVISDVYGAFGSCTGWLMVYPESAVEKDGYITWEKNGKTRMVGYLGNEEIATVPEGIEEIYTDAFYPATETVEIILPESLEKLFEYSCYADNVQKVTFKGTKVPEAIDEDDSGKEISDVYAYEDIFDSSMLEAICVPEDAYGEYLNAFWEIGDRLYVEGIEPAPDEEGFIILDDVLLGYEGAGGNLVIPDGVTAIVNSVFSNNTSITSVEFSQSLKKIGEDAFCGCQGLTGDLVFPDGMEYVGGYAFANCGTAIELLWIPDGMQYLNSNAFRNTGAEKIMVGSGITDLYWLSQMDTTSIYWVVLTETGEISADLLNSANLSSVPFDVGVREANLQSYETVRKDTGWPEAFYAYYEGDYLINYYMELEAYYGKEETVNIPEGVEGVYGDVFTNRTDIKKIVFPSSLTSLNWNALEGMSGVETLVFTNEAIPYSTGEALSYMKTLPESIVLQGLSIEGYNYSLEQLTGYFGNTLNIEVQGIEPNADGLYILEENGVKALIAANSNLENIVVPEGVSLIAAGAFMNCENLKSVTLPSTLEKAGYAIFGWTDAEEVHFKGTMLPKLWISVNNSGPAPESLLSDEAYEGEIIFPECLGTNQANWILAGPEWKKIVVPEEVFYGYRYIFDGYEDVIESDGSGKETLEFVVDEDGILLQYAGPGGEVVIPENVKYIPEGVFTGMENITSVTLPEGLEAIGDSAFENCAILSGTLKIPNSVVSIGNAAFRNTSIEHIVWGSELQYIGTYAFANCGQLRTMVAFPDKLTEIGDYAFYYTEKLTGKIVFPDSLTYIGWHGFSYSGLEEIKLGTGLSYLEYYLFSGCENLSGTVVIPDSVTSISSSAFSGCKNITEVILPDTLTSIGSSAFSNCTGITGALEIPGSVTSIGSSAFYGCTGISGKLVIPDSVTSIGMSAFNGCSGIKEIYLGEGVTSLGSRVFYGCSALELISYGSKFKSFGSNCMYNNYNLTTYIFKGTTVPTFYNSSSSDSYGSCFPEFCKNATIYTPASARSAYSSKFQYVKRATKTYSDYLQLAAENIIIIDSVENGVEGVYFSFENSHEIHLSKWQVLQNGSVVLEVTDGSTGAFISGGSTENSYMLKVYDNSNNSYTFGAAAEVLEGSYGPVHTSYDDNVITEDKDILSIDVWFASEKKAENAGTATFYYEDIDGTTVVIADGVAPDAIQDGRKRTYEIEWDVSLLENSTYPVWVNVEGEATGSESATIIIQKENQLPKVKDFAAEAQDNGDVALTWAEMEDKDSIIPAITGYHIYRTDASGIESLVAVVDNKTEWFDKTVISGQTCTYRVCVADSHGREGEFSESKTVTVEKDTQAPEIIPEVADQTHFKESQYFDFSAKDNRGISTLKLFIKNPDSKNFVLYTTEYSEEIYCWYGVGETEESAVVQFKVVALDRAGNETEEIYTYHLDFASPLAVTKAKTAADGAKALTVTWDASVSDDVAKYIVTLGDTTKEILSTEEYKATFTALAYDTDYEISIVAEDAVGNQSEACMITGHTAENIAPSVELIGPEGGSICHGTVTWTIDGKDDYQVNKTVLEYSVDQKNWTQIASWSGSAAETSNTKSVNLDNYKGHEKIYLRAYAVDSESLKSAYAQTYINLDYKGPVVDDETFTSEYSSSKLHLSFKQSADTDADHYVLYYVNSLNQQYKRTTFTHNNAKEGQIFTYSDSLAVFGEHNTYKIVAVDKYGNESSVVKSHFAYNYVAPTVGKITVEGSPEETIAGGIYNKITALVSYSDHSLVRAEEVVKGTFSYVGFDGETYSVEAEKAISTEGEILSAALDLSTIREQTEITLTVQDSSGNTYTKNQTLRVVTEQPEAVYGLYVYSDETKIYLNWTEATEITTTSYRIYRKVGDGSFEVYKVISGRNVLSYEDTNVIEDETYSYYMTAVSEMGIESDPCLILTAQLKTDTEAPELTLNPADKTTFGKSIRITASGTDNIAVKAIRLYKVNGKEQELLVEKQGNYVSYTYTPSEDENEGIIVIRGEAEDGKGLTTYVERSYILDKTGPEKVVNLTSSVTATTAVINWDDVKDSDFSYFSLELFNEETQKFEEIQKISNYRGVALENLEPQTTYVYRVVAYDRYGNRGTVSERIEVTTAADTISPVITRITPSANYYNKDFTVNFTAEDDVAVTKMIVQHSVNCVEWTNLKTFEYTSEKETITCSYTFKSEDYEDGKFQVRAIAYDKAGNVSDQSATAPFTEYGFDRVAPSVPENVSAAISNGYINVSWNDNTESDKNGYNVYRALQANGTYQKVANSIRYTNYPDRSTLPETTYYYKVSVVDKYGNESECSTPVSIKMKKDDTAPVIYSISPATKSVLTASDKYIQIKVADNYQLDKILVEYAVNDEVYKELHTEENLNATEKIISIEIPEDVEHEDILHIKAKVVDGYGNESEEKAATYTFDKEVPEIGDLSYEVNDLDVTLSWSCDSEDINGFYIYRKAGSETYKRIGSQAGNDSGTYSWTDATIIQGMKYYTYMVKAVDTSGNTSTITTDQILITVEVPEYPNAYLMCTTSMQVGTEYIFDATESSTADGDLTYQIDFGDGTTATTPYVVHKYEETGNYTVKLTVTNEKGYSNSISYDISVYERAVLGTVNVKVTNESGKVLSGVPVYFDMDHTTDNILRTNTNGIASFTERAGTYKVGAYKDGYLPDQSQVIITAGNTRTVTLVVEEEELVTGTFEVNRMTLSEIQAAGIDISDPANQHVMEANVTIVYGSQEVNVSCYSNAAGVSKSSVTKIKTSSGERKLIAKPICTGTKSSPSSGNGGGDYEPDAVAILDIPVTASCLKEFFDVKLHIINNATKDFHLVDNKVQLNIPDGISLVRAGTAEKSEFVQFDSLSGQDQHTISWILRGDVEGSYNLTADYSAILQEFDADVTATFETDEPIKVYGTSNLEFVIQVNETLQYNTAYFVMGLRNKGTTDILCPSIDVAEETIQATALTGLKDKKCDVELLEERVSNDKGFSQVVTSAPGQLAAGEMYSKKYAVYGAASDTDLGYLQDVMVYIAEGYGFKVVVEKVNMDLYNVADADEKVENMLNGSSSHAYDYLTTDCNFAYYLSYGYAKEDVSDEIYDFGQIFFNANFDSVTKYQEEEIVKSMLSEMMMDSSIQQNVQEKVDAAYLDTAKDILENVQSAAEIVGDDGDTRIDDFLNDADAIAQLSEALKLNGASEDFLEAAIAIAGSLGYQKLQTSLQKKMGNTFLAATAEELNDQLSGVSDVLGVISDTVEDWNTAADSVNLLMNMQYSYEESTRILSAMAQAEDETISSVAQVQLQKVQNQRASMAQEFAEIWAKGLVNETASGVSSSLQKVFEGKTVTKVYGWACVVYNIEDQIFGWSETYNAQEKSVIAGKMTDTFTKYMETATDSTSKLHALRYVIKMRFIGERTFTELLTRAYEKEGYDEETIKQKVVSWYDNQVMKIAKYRDAIFKTEATQLDVPAAPKASIDYENLCTKESFDSTYEYSFNNDTWITCKGTPISFTPKVYSATLYIRVKGNEEHVAGSIRMLSLPTIRRFDKEARVLYYDGVYTIKGLSEGQLYQYAISDTSEAVWLGVAEPSKDGIITISTGAEKKDYLILRLAATDNKIASESKCFAVKEVQDVATPKANVKAGNVKIGTQIKLSCATENAIIYYTTDGSTPTRDSKIWTPYTELKVNKSFTLKTMASIPEDEGYHDSKVATYKYKAVKLTQKITVGKSSYTYYYSKNKTFSLNAKAKTKLTYKTSNSKVATVSSKGKITIKGYGTATITITAASSSVYSSTKRTVKVMVKPLKVSWKSLKAGSKKLTIKFVKQTRATGYQVQYSTSSKFTSSKTKTVKLGKNTTTKTIYKLKKNKKYYVRIRAYTTVGGKTLYGNWSKVKSCRIK